MARTRGTVAERVVQRVADSTGTDALELPPLYGTVDPDALEALVETMSDGEISFTYAGRDVTVDSDGAVGLRGGSNDHDAGTYQ